MTQRTPVDIAAYVEGVRTRPCFVCSLVAGDPDFAHHVFYEDEAIIGFLAKYPMQRGYCLVCPKAHRESLAHDLSLDEHLALQTVVHRTAQALSQVLPVERVYVMSLGSQQGNRHLHWHVVPLPPGVPYDEQQLAAVDLSRGVIPMTDDEMAALAGAITAALAVPATTRPATTG